MTITLRSLKGQALTSEEQEGNIVDLDVRPNGQAYPKAKGIGIKVDSDNPDWGWHDIIGSIGTFADDANRAIFTNYSGNLSALQFSVGKQGFVNFHIPHDYAMGTDIFVHVHWSHISATLTTGAPTFLIDGTYAKGHNQADSAFGTPISLTLSEPASTTQFQHMVTEDALSAPLGAGGLIDTSKLEPDGLIMLRVSTSSNTMDGGADPFIHFVDLHYQSTGLATKQKSPDFWT